MDDPDKLLIVTEGYNPTTGGFIHSVRGALHQIHSPEGPTGPLTFMTSVTRTKRLPDETREEVNQLNISFIEPDWKMKPTPSRELLTKHHRDYFSRQITKIPGIKVVVGTEPYTAQAASYIRDELTEIYDIKTSSSRSSGSRASSSGSGYYAKSSSIRPSSTSSSSKQKSFSSSSSRPCDVEDGVKYVIVNYLEGDECEDDDSHLPGERGVEFVQNARDADVIISVGLRVYNYWQTEFHMDGIAHEPYIPFESILSQGNRKVPVDTNTNAIKRVLTLDTGIDILSSEFHQRIAGILGTIAQIKADQYETNFLTWVVQVDVGLSDDKKKEIRSRLAQWSKSKALKIQLTSPETKSQIERQVMVSSLVLMPGMFHASGYSGLESMMASVPCLVPDDSDVGAVIRLEDALDTAFLLPPLGYTDSAEHEWKKKILKLLTNEGDAHKHARDLRTKLETSALYERSTRLFAEILYGVKSEENPCTDSPIGVTSGPEIQSVQDEAGLEVDPDEVEKEHTLLGRGSFSVVYPAVYRGQRVALKTINTGSLTITQQEAFRSVSILAKLKHDNVIRLIGYALEEQRLHVLMELMTQSMGDCINSENNDLTEELKLQVAYQCCAGLHHLHTRYIVHQDIKPANILLTSDMIPKIADFDIARTKRHVHGPTTMTTKGVNRQPGSPFYQPPEVYVEKAHFWSDVWSLGGTLAEWFTFQPLWTIPQGQSDVLKVPEYIGKTTTPHALENLRPDILPILKPALSYDKHQRPTALEMQVAFQECRDGKGFKGYRKKKTNKKNNVWTYLISGLLTLILGPLVFWFRHYYDHYPTELVAAGFVVLCTSVVVNYMYLSGKEWILVTTLTIVFIIALIMFLNFFIFKIPRDQSGKIPPGQVDTPSEGPVTVPPETPSPSGPSSEGTEGGSEQDPETSIPTLPEPSPTQPTQEPSRPEQPTVVEPSTSVDTGPRESSVPADGPPPAAPEIPLTEQYPGVPVAISPDDAERVLSTNGHNDMDLQTSYEGQVIYKNKLVRYKLKGEIKWKGLKSKFKWRCKCWLPGQTVESEWFLGRASALTDALKRLGW